MKIEWTIKAQIEYISILEYIQSDFSLKEVEKFIAKTNNTLLLISKKPLMVPIVTKAKCT